MFTTGLAPILDDRRRSEGAASNMPCFNCEEAEVLLLALCDDDDVAWCVAFEKSPGTSGACNTGFLSDIGM
jgi:hypothetical protein